MRAILFACFALLAFAARAEGPRYLSVTFDDGWDIPQSVWERFREADITGTLYVNTKPLDERWAAYSTWEEIHALPDEGWEIGSHSVSHAELPDMWGEPMLEELLISKLQILKNVGEMPKSFATPFGATDPRVDWYIDRYFDSSAKAWGNYGMNTWIDPMKINRLGVTDKAAPGWVCSRMREIPPGGWLVLMFHQVGLDGSEYSVSLKSFRQIVGCIEDAMAKQGVIVDTVSGVLERDRRYWVKTHVPYPDRMGP